jgi:DUF4097 and DUF4098 domain-containing protein YvlB
MRSIVFGFVAVLLAHTAASETIERTLDVSPRGEVEILNVSGDVRVIGWERPQVQLRADIDSGVDEVQFERRGDRTTVRVKVQRNAERGSADLVVHVPRDSTLLSVKTVSASQRIEGVRGEQRLQSVSGRVETEVFNEDFEGKTVSGEIVVNGHGETSAHLTSVSGRLVLENVGGDLDLNTVNGEMQVLGGAIERARLKTTNGRMRIEGSLRPDARFDAESINGAIELQLRGSLDAEFNVETFNGAIRNCFGPKPQRTDKYAPGLVLRFTEGKGSARVRLKTLNGGIELCKK